MEDNQHRPSVEAVQRHADDKGCLARADQVEPTLTALDIAHSLRHARLAISRAVEVRLVNMELRDQTAVLRQRAADARQQSRSLRNVPHGSREASQSR